MILTCSFSTNFGGVLVWPWDLQSILWTYVSVYLASYLVMAFYVCFVWQHLRPCCDVFQSLLCTACIWGPMWCGRPWPLLIKYLGPVFVQPWSVPLFCLFSQLFPAIDMVVQWKPLLQFGGGPSYAEACPFITAPLVPLPCFVSAVWGIHLAGNQWGPSSWCIPGGLLLNFTLCTASRSLIRGELLGVVLTLMACISSSSQDIMPVVYLIIGSVRVDSPDLIFYIQLTLHDSSPSACTWLSLTSLWDPRYLLLSIYYQPIWSWSFYIT